MGKITRSEQQLPSVPSETFVEPHSAHKSKITEEERALGTHENKRDLEEYGGETKNNIFITVSYYCVNFTCTVHTYIFMNPLVRTLLHAGHAKRSDAGLTGVHLKAAHAPNIKAAY